MTPKRNSNRGVWTISNIITMVRILLVPVFVAALLAPWPEWFGMNKAFSNDWKSIVAAGIFVLISCTDWLDGYLARSRDEVTDFGKFMDPLADKILVAAALIALVELGSLPTWAVLVILAREFIVSGVRMVAATKGVVIAASMLGKFKTVFQMVAIVLFTIKGSHMIGDFSEALADTLWMVSWAVMLIALALTIASMVDYLIKARELIGLGANAADSGAAELPEEASSDITVCSESSLHRKAALVVKQAMQKRVTIATAESLTGGMIGSTLTSIAGSSAVFRGGIISYVNDVKERSLGVPKGVLDSEGAVCEDVAQAMAEGARSALTSDIAISVTGIAGPGGEEPGKPVGTVWMGVSSPNGVSSKVFHFKGSREEVRMQTTHAALEALLGEISESAG